MIADRYASSNQIHQGGKISNSAKRKEFLDLKHLSDAKNSAIELVKKNNNWARISCAKNGKPLAIEEINKNIMEKITLLLN